MKKETNYKPSWNTRNGGFDNPPPQSTRSKDTPKRKYYDLDKDNPSPSAASELKRRRITHTREARTVQDELGQPNSKGLLEGRQAVNAGVASFASSVLNQIMRPAEVRSPQRMLSPELMESPTSTLVESPTNMVVESPTNMVVESPTNMVVESPTNMVVESPTSTVQDANRVRQDFSESTLSPQALLSSMNEFLQGLLQEERSGLGNWGSTAKDRMPPEYWREIQERGASGTTVSISAERRMSSENIRTNFEKFDGIIKTWQSSANRHHQDFTRFRNEIHSKEFQGLLREYEDNISSFKDELNKVSGRINYLMRLREESVKGAVKPARNSWKGLQRSIKSLLESRDKMEKELEKT